MLIQIGFEILRVQNSVKIMQMRERNGSLLHSSTLALRNARKTLGKGRDCSQPSILMKSKQESYRGAYVRGGLCPGRLINGCFYRCCLQVDRFLTGGLISGSLLYLLLVAGTFS